jgi:hypothetical protein
VDTGQLERARHDGTASVASHGRATMLTSWQCGSFGCGIRIRHFDLGSPSPHFGESRGLSTALDGFGQTALRKLVGPRVGRGLIVRFCSLLRALIASVVEGRVAASRLLRQWRRRQALQAASVAMEPAARVTRSLRRRSGQAFGIPLRGHAPGDYFGS